MKNLRSPLTPKTPGARLIVALIAIAFIASVFTSTAKMQEKKSEKDSVVVEAAAALEDGAKDGEKAAPEQPARALIGDTSTNLSSSANVPERDAPLAGLTGTKNIPGDYATLALAITDLNTNGVGSGGVTFNVLAGNPQTAPAGGYVIGGTGSLVLTSSSAANPIVFTGNSNTITAANPQTVGNINDGIIKLIGADFVTIQGFTIQENPLNTVIATAATNNATEFGIGLFYVTTTDGAQNNTIQNNTITMNRAYANTFCIFSTTRASSTAVGTTADATTQAGTNSNTHIYTNNLSNANYAIVFLGSSVSSPQETGTDIGGASAATGNTITNTATGTAALSTYITLTGSNYAIFLNHQINDNVSFNSITTASVAGAVTVGGILKNYSVTNPTGTITTTINNNTVTATNNPTAATTGAVIGINNQGLTTFLSTATMSLNNNTVQNCVLGGTTSTTNGITGITNLSLPGTLNMTGNSVINNAITATTATTGINAGITNSGAAGTVNINNNVVRSLASTATSGQTQGIANAGAVTTAINIKDNHFGNATSGFFSTATATSGAIFGAVNSAGAAGALLTMTGNDIRGITYTGAASASQNYYNNQVFTGSVNISSNTITNITVNTTGSVTMIGNSVTRAAGTTATVNNNSIVTQFSKTAAGGTIAFYNSFGSSPATVTEINTGNNFSNVTFTGATAFIGWRSADGTTPGPRKTVTNNTFSNITGGTSALTSVLYVGFSDNTFANNNVSGNVISNVSAAASISAIFSDGQNQNFFDNRINTLNSTGAAAVVRAIELTGATTQNVFRNKIYDIQATDAAGTVNGIAMTAGTTFNVYNNLIGDLRTPAANTTNPLIGINITGGTTVNAYFNTVYLNATSSGTPFGSSAISASTTPTLTLRNNVFVNASTPAGAGLSVAYRRSSTTLTTYSSASNNNDFFASTIFNDGTNTDSTIAAYKTRVASRDSASFSENPTFLSTTGSNANFLHISTAVATQLESGGTPVSGITDDFDGQTRNVSTPDVGADEFAGIALDLSPPVISYTTLGNGAAVASRDFANVTVTDASGVNTTAGTRPRVYYKKGCDASNTFNDNTNATAGWKFAEANGAGGSPFTFTIDYSRLPACGGGSGAGVVAAGDTIQYFVVAQDLAGTPNVGINSGTFAAPPSSVALTSAAFPIGGTINSYNIVASFSGTKTVCTSGCDYASLTNTGGLFEAINAGILTSNLTVRITSNLTAETGTVSLNQTSEEGAGNYTITIQAFGGARLISGSNTTALINLNGADRVTFNGLTSGPQSLTIRNTSATTGAVIQLTNDASNNSVFSCAIEGGNTSTSSALILLASGTTTGNDNNNIISNIIRDRTDTTGVPANLVASLNSSTTATNSNNSIGSNQLINFTSNGFAASSAATSDNWTISFNDISQTAARTTTIFGINTGGPTGTNLIADNTIHGFNTNGTNTSLGILIGNAGTVTVLRNRIYDFQTTAGATGAIEGIEFDGASGATPNALIANNMVTLAPTLATAQSIIGIYDNGFGGNVFNAFYNSIYIGGTATGSASSWALRRGISAPTTYTAKDNIAYNNRTGGTGSHFAGGDQSANTGTFVSDYNFFVGTGATAANFMDYGTSSSGTPVSFTAWKAGPPTRDANSIAGIASGFTASNFFVDTTTGDLHLKFTATPVLNTGTPVASVITDFDGVTRSATTPDIGADEVTFTGSVQLSSATYSVGESGGSIVINVTRTGGSDGAASVHYATADGTAGSADYTAQTGTLNWTDGDAANKTITVPINDDGIFEGDETFSVSLDTATGATLGSPATATVTINDNDSAPAFSIDDVTHSEGDTGTTSYTFTVTKTGATASNATVDYATVNGTATAPSDFTAISPTTLTFLPGDATRQVTVLVNGDTTVEPNEAFTVHLSNVTGATISDADGTGTITNDDVRPLPNTVYVDDDFTGPVGSDPDGAGPATEIGYDAFPTIQGGTDGVASGGTVNVAAGTYPEQPVIGKSLTMVGAGAGVTNITAPMLLATRFNNFYILLEVNNGANVEASGITVRGEMNMNGCHQATPASTFRRYYGVYVRGGASLNLHDASVLDIREQNPAANTNCRIGTAIDAGTTVAGLNQVGTLTLANTTVTGFQSRAVTVDNAGSSATITNNTLTGSTSTNLSQTVVLVSIGATAQISGNQITGAQCSDAVNCGPDTFNQAAAVGISLTAPGTGTQITNNTISNNDYGLNTVAAPNVTLLMSGNTFGANRYFGVNVSEGSATLTGNTFSGVSNVAVVAASVNDPANQTASDSAVTLTGNTITGATTAFQLLDQTGFPADGFFPVMTAHFNRVVAATAIDNTQNSPGSNFENNWWGCNAGPGQTGCGAVNGTVDFNPWLVLTVSAAPNPIVPGGTSTVTADLLHNSDNLVPSMSTFVPGTPVSFSATEGTVMPTSGTIVNGVATTAFTSTSASSGTASATVDNQTTSTNINVTAPAFSIDDVTHMEGNAGTTAYVFTVTRTGATPFNSSVQFQTNDGTATLADSDYQSNSGTLTFLPAETTKQITVLVNGDTTYEPNEAFTVNLSNPNGATITTATGNGVINNDDAPPSTLVVNTTDDIDNGFCLPSHCSLREAINAANASADVSTINFNISGAGVHIITPSTSLPVIGQPVLINGYSQPGASANTLSTGSDAVLLIQLDGINAGAGVDGIILDGGNSTVSGLSIVRFTQRAILLSNGVGGNTVTGNYLGVDASGTLAMGNGNGVYADTGNNDVGGIAPADRNVVSGNSSGVVLAGSNATTNRVRGNYIGTDATGTLDRGNTSTGITIQLGANGNQIGGTVSGAGNVISGNGTGIRIVDDNSANNTIQGNRIGTDASGASALGNDDGGVSIIGNAGTSGNVIGGVAAGEANVIASNGHAGIALNGAGAVNNSIRGNSIFANNGLGIDLQGDGVTPNDAGDADTGANNLQNFPVITSALVTGSTRTITGTLNSASGQTFIVDFYSSPSCNDAPPSDFGEGQTYLGSTTTGTTDGNGDVSFTFHPAALTASQFITATATDASGNTSEFSQCFASAGGTPGAIVFTSATYTVGEGGTTAQINVTRTGGSDGSISATFNTSDGTATAGSDYTAVTGYTVTYADGETGNKSIDIPISEDMVYEGDETVNLSLSGSTVNLTSVVGPVSATLTITDNDAPPSFSIDDVTHMEGNAGTTSYVFTVTKTGTTAVNASVDYATMDGTATAPSDYTAIPATTLTFLPAETTHQFTVLVNGDTDVEPTEAFTVHLSNASGATIADADGTGTIVTDDTAASGILAFSSATYSVNENVPAHHATITVTRTGGTNGTVSVDYATSDGTAASGSDYTTATGTLTFADGIASQTFDVPVTDDNLYEGNETVNLALSNPQGGTSSLGSPASAVLTIIDNETPPSVSINDVTVNEGQSGTTSLNFTVSLSGPSAFPVTVNYQTANSTAHAPGDYQSASGMLSFPANNTSQPLSLTAFGDTVIEGNETFFVNLSGASGATLGDAQGLATLDNDDGPTNRRVFTKFDFDGDSKTDVATWDGATGNWHVINSNGGVEAVQFDWGRSDLGDMIVPADYDGDGHIDFAVFRPSEGNWYIIRSSTVTSIIENWGQAGDVPIPGDYDGDNRADVAVFRPSEGNWYIRNSRDGSVTLRNWGVSSDQPVPSDYDGDRMTDIAVYRPSEGNWYIINSSTGAVTLVNWGAGSDRPAPGDYDGDGKTDITIFRAAGNWYIRNSSGGVTLRNWGNASDKLVPGDYDGDGKTDIAVYRPSEGVWYVINSNNNTGSNYYLGGGGEVPVPSAFIH